MDFEELDEDTQRDIVIEKGDDYEAPPGLESGRTASIIVGESQAGWSGAECLLSRARDFSSSSAAMARGLWNRDIAGIAGESFWVTGTEGGQQGAEKWTESQEIGRAHVWTPVTLIYLVCRLLLEKKKKHYKKKEKEKQNKKIYG